MRADYIQLSSDLTLRRLRGLCVYIIEEKESVYQYAAQYGRRQNYNGTTADNGDDDDDDDADVELRDQQPSPASHSLRC